MPHIFAKQIPDFNWLRSHFDDYEVRFATVAAAEGVEFMRFDAGNRDLDVWSIFDVIGMTIDSANSAIDPARTWQFFDLNYVDPKTSLERARLFAVQYGARIVTVSIYTNLHSHCHQKFAAVSFDKVSTMVAWKLAEYRPDAFQGSSDLGVKV